MSTSHREAWEVFIVGVIAMSLLLFATLVMWKTSREEPEPAQVTYNPINDLAMCPACHIEKHVSWDKCNGLAQQPWKDCMRTENE